MPPEILTIGHSTHTLDDFLGLLAQHRVEALVDIRRFPGSRKYPQFGQESLAAAVREAGIEYLWLEVLGGRRSKPKSPSVNLGLRNESFRNYADYMPSAEFHEGIERLLDIARRKRTAIMCAEGVFWRCHRRLVSDFLVARGATVQHIMPTGQLRPHSLTDGAKVQRGQVTYPAMIAKE